MKTAQSKKVNIRGVDYNRQAMFDNLPISIQGVSVTQTAISYKDHEGRWRQCLISNNKLKLSKDE